MRLQAFVGFYFLLLCSIGVANQVCDDGGASDNTFPDIPRIDSMPKIDGQLDDAGWDQALRVKLGIETKPGENITAPVETEALLAENGSHLLVAFKAQDPHPEQIRAFIRDRDSSYNDDFVGIALDTFNDERFAFEFFANPYGAQMDLTYDDIGGNETDSWDAIWDSAGSITANGYNVEIAIPLQQLRFPKSLGPQVWGIDLVRFYPRQQRHRISNNPQDRSRDCYLCQLKKFNGFACAAPGKNLVIAPTLTTTRSETSASTGNNLESGGTDLEPGLDLRWGITPDLTLSGTLNPDFSQVEADIAQLSVNERFELFFPEKRPFFLDGADFFETPIDAVFTRTIADPDVGAKLVGKLDQHNFGVFVAQDTKTNFLFPGAQQSDTATVARDSDAFVGRYRYNVGQNSALGLLVTRREGSDYSNQIFGMDGRYRFTNADSIKFQYLNSETKYPAQLALDNDQPRTLSGTAGIFSYNHRSRNWRYYAQYKDIEKGFRADLGFVPQVDFNHMVFGVRHNWFPEGAFKRVNFGGDWDIQHDQNGRVLERELEGSVWTEGPMQSFLELGLGQRARLAEQTLFNETFGFFFGRFRPIGGLNASLFVRFGEQIDFDNILLADINLIQPELNINIGKNLELKVRHTFQELSTKSSNQSIFKANLSDTRLTWQFSVRSFLRLVVQHQDIKRNTDIYAADTEGRSRNLATQLLYSYKLNPQTVFFLGYSDAAEDGTQLTRFTKTERTLFAKFGYAWLP